MKNKLLRAFICLFAAVIAPFCTLSVSAVSVDPATDIVEAVIRQKLDETGSPSVQSWIDGGLSDLAGSAEWYIIALSQYGDYDFSAYRRALLKYLAETDPKPATARLKYALALIGTGSSDGYIAKAAGDAIGRQGVMSLVFGLHLLNNGVTCDGYDTASAVSELLSLQLADGGWAVSGTVGDVDVTAMALSSLAVQYREGNAAVLFAVEKALELLSDRQNPDGDYSSYGTANAESTAQVLTALSSLGIDCLSDSRFIKNGKTVFDGLLLYRLPDGTFSHVKSGSTNESATVQAFYSSVAYLRMVAGKTPLFVLDAEPSDAGETQQPTGDSEGSGIGYKLPACLAVVFIAGGACAVLFLLKKREPRNYLLILAAAAAAVLLIVCTDIQSAESFYSQADREPENSVGTVYVAIYCDTIEDKSAAHIPDDGVLLGITETAIGENSTVFDVLCRVTARHRIQLETGGSGETAYVYGIGGIYESDYGDLSGWMYYVNGEAPPVGCGRYVLSDGDTVEWKYTCRLGEDIK